LVEDNPDNAELIKVLLKKEAWGITIAENGVEALELYPTKPWDMILMDIQMPLMDGLTATRKIREMEKKLGKKIKIIALTALAQLEDRQTCLDAGMDDYLAKPIKKKVLLEMLNKHV
jgi:CheY-like chemotaxis protein